MSEEKAPNEPSALTTTHLLDTDFTIEIGGAYRPCKLKHWSKVPYWKAEEAACITLGYDPESILSSSLEHLQQFETLCDLVFERARIIGRACEVGKLSVQIAPSDCLELLTSRDELFPPSLTEFCLQYSSELAPVSAKIRNDIFAKLETLEGIKADSENDELSAGERKKMKSLEKMVLAMSIEKFGYVPNKRNEAATRIHGALTKIELSLHTDTIRSTLNECSKKHWNPNF